MTKARPYLCGRMLDAGCGNQRYKEMFKFDDYVGLEVNDRFRPDVVGDLRYMPFKNEEFDSILNNQVLEHIDDTHKVFSEFYRLLKPGGYLCITVPFISRIHEVPHDYWRISEYGIRYLFEKHGFKEIEITNMGGFLTTQAYLWQFWLWERLASNSLSRSIRKPLMWIGNHIFLFLHCIDRDRSTPFNYIAIGKKFSSMV
ncbi:class I SAM-dependent methyltransferase [Candidatus Contendibacter odensensis]|nr:class I SAM-dependent methyltransferase [Candidatus Contendobacter odensis]